MNLFHGLSRAELRGRLRARGDEPGPGAGHAGTETAAPRARMNPGQIDSAVHRAASPRARGDEPAQIGAICEAAHVAPRAGG